MPAPVPPPRQPIQPDQKEGGKSELEVLREQVAVLSQAITELNAKREVGEDKAVVAPVHRFKAWEEDLWVEALQDCVYPDPPEFDHKSQTWSQEYGIPRRGRRQDSDEKGNPITVKGAIFQLKHREHLQTFLREIKKDELDKVAPPVRVIPETTARSQRRIVSGR
jgi:hypothetical protein